MGGSLKRDITWERGRGLCERLCVGVVLGQAGVSIWAEQKGVVC